MRGFPLCVAAFSWFWTRARPCQTGSLRTSTLRNVPFVCTAACRCAWSAHPLPSACRTKENFPLLKRRARLAELNAGKAALVVLICFWVGSCCIPCSRSSACYPPRSVATTAIRPQWRCSSFSAAHCCAPKLSTSLLELRFTLSLKILGFYYLSVQVFLSVVCATVRVLLAARCQERWSRCVYVG